MNIKYKPVVVHVSLSCSVSSSAAPPGVATGGRRWLLVLQPVEAAAASHIPAFALSSSLPPPSLSTGEHHTLSANQSSAPPSPSHHLSFQGNRAPRSLSLSVSSLKGAASSSSSLPSVHPTVPSRAGG